MLRVAMGGPRRLVWVALWMCVCVEVVRGGITLEFGSKKPRPVRGVKKAVGAGVSEAGSPKKSPPQNEQDSLLTTGKLKTPPN